MAVDITDLAGAEPDDLLADPSRILRHDPLSWAARALRYARDDPRASYDTIGFRLRAATPTQMGRGIIVPWRRTAVPG